MSLSSFGRLADGREVRIARLARPEGLAVEVMEYGATIRSITVPTATGAVQAILGYGVLADYEAGSAYIGPLVGRCANRIAGAQFALDGNTFRLTANEGPNTLHGGARGFDKRLWTFAAPADPEGPAVTLPAVTLVYVSPDGEEGFPGRVEVRARYALIDAQTLEIAYEATTDAPTALNLSQHLYFNLSGRPGGDVLDHTLRVAGDAITPTGPGLIPTGEIMAVEDTPFDLRSPRRIGEVLAQAHPQLTLAKGLDHNWALSEGAGPALDLHDPGSGLTLSIETDQPGLQVYSGQGLTAPFVKHGAMVFEPQGYPDAPNHPGFPSVFLRPGETYRRRSTYRFRVDPAD